MVPLAREVKYVSLEDFRGPFFLAGDIGGTNSNFGIFSLEYQEPVLLISLHYKSRDVLEFAVFMQEVIGYIESKYGITFEKGCIGAAGIIYPTRIWVKPTNLSFEINLSDVIHLTSFKKLLLINDFEAVALGVELLKPSDIVTVHKGHGYTRANKGFLGAGTGLGKSILSWGVESNRYLPIVSEGGHADACFYPPETELMNFLYAISHHNPVSWEDILSGAGIQKIYRFLGTLKKYPLTEATLEIERTDFNPDRISFYAQHDARSRDTFTLYIKLYARCAKNFALDALTLNGLYIAGGIAAKNISMFFDPLFRQEFIRCQKHNKKVQQIPIHIIANYNVSLYGAIVADRLHEQNLL